MRFKFCGDRDCPDWLLAEIASLSKISSVKTKLLCVQAVNALLTSTVDFEKASKLTADSKFTPDDLKGVLVALEFILKNATKFAVDEETLVNELQQLGLPREHAVSLSKVYADKSADILTVLKKQSLRLSSLEGNPQWRVDYVLESSVAGEVAQPSVQMKLLVRDSDREPKPVHFSMTAETCSVLLHELKQAYNLRGGVLGIP
ncbi:COMM domain-containing protein, putative [Ixodes scapularis]|uniref:COMM domain-containing protein, putative n=1 Tax=Ixodes scapularis TaxID=6945 RepID=B7Q6Q1_IXOSC|nr:COMM domain-containing protein, putative [Ixodes scapularis]|eukprot:XP_002412018.1 COMM domain-containing protein, putative [Ixodes scapularis]